MSNNLDFTCPNCKETIVIPDSYFGKRMKCPECFELCTVDASTCDRHNEGDDVKVVTKKGSGKAPKARAVEREKYDVGDRLCPSCRKSMEKGAVICLNCGYNTKTREKTEVIRNIKPFEMTWGPDLHVAIRIAAFLFFPLPPLFICLGDYLFALFFMLPSLCICAAAMTYFTTTIRRDKQGNLTLTKQWYTLFFVPVSSTVLDLKKQQELHIAHSSPGVIPAITFLLLFCYCGCVPLIVYYMTVEAEGVVSLSLAYRGEDGVCIYRGWQKNRWNEIIETLNEYVKLETVRK